MSRVKNLAEEARELGLSNFAFRIGWELKRRGGWLQWTSPPAPDVSQAARYGTSGLLDRRTFAKAPDVAHAMADAVPAHAKAIRSQVEEELQGRILAFSSQILDYGSPPSWHRHPLTGLESDPKAHWSRIEARDARGGDVKFVLEAGRFPHAYRIARAAARFPDRAPVWANALCDQIANFRVMNPFGLGVHWFSSQELTLRLLAWTFAHDAFASLGIGTPRLREVILQSAMETGVHILEHFDYSRRSTYNNHLLAEALGLLLVGALIPGWSESPRCLTLGLETLNEQSDRQFYKDGSYILNSHNYQRGSLQTLLAADRIWSAIGETTPSSLLAAMDRSLTFLFAHQNPGDGSLPNYGPNDGSLPMVLSDCGFSDFRPTLAAVSLRCRGERAYERGPWDEEAAWFLGGRALEVSMKAPPKSSVVFQETGYVVMRGKSSDDFACIRCGNIPSRFSQIDMLHFDLWWRGQNVLVDGGSFLYNGDPAWHHHFHRTASHNTIEVDGHDQMLHYRPFKNLYWTKGHVRRFEVREDLGIFDGEHEGYRRFPGNVVHRRQVITDRAGAWLVRDRVTGEGSHHLRLHWLMGPFPASLLPPSEVQVETPKGALQLRVSGMPAHFVTSLVEGQEDPPRGFLARTYGERRKTPSLAIAGTAPLPLTLDTWIGPQENIERSSEELRQIMDGLA